MNAERTWKCLRQAKNIRDHLWHRYSVTANQVMVTTVKLSKWWLQLNQLNFIPPFSIFSWRTSWLEVGITGHICGRGPSKDYSTKVWLQLAQWFLHRTLWQIPIKIFLSETICSIRTKFWWNSHWMVLFQKCVRWLGPSTKMAPTA
jgi:hypothetical protein